jgi:hypothetical protein
MRHHTLAALLAVSFLFAGPAWAGHPQERKGFWVGFGGGYGSAIANADCPDCGGGNREGSFAGFFKLGGTLNERVLLGVESNAWRKEQEGVRLTLGNVSGTVTFYPQASSGFFLKAGLGLAYMDTQVENVSINKTGLGVLGGLGYDIRVGRNISITPCANYYYGKPGDVTVLGEPVLPGFNYNVFDFGIGITFH